MSAPSRHFVAIRREFGALVVQETSQRERIAYLNIGRGPIAAAIDRITARVVELVCIDFESGNVELNATRNKRFLWPHLGETKLAYRPVVCFEGGEILFDHMVSRYSDKTLRETQNKSGCSGRDPAIPHTDMPE